MRPRGQARLLAVASYVMLAVTALVVALCLMSVAQALGIQPWDARAWWAGLLPSYDDAFFLIVVVTFLQAIIWNLRVRAAWRVRALAGDTDAMDLALPGLVLGEGEQAQTLFTSAPIALRWELTRRERMMRFLPWGIFAAFLFGGAALLLVLHVTLEGIAFDPGDLVDQAFVAGAIALTLVGLVIALVALVAASRGPSGVSADSAGVSVWTPHGLGALLPWREVRLLEASWFGVPRGKALPYIRAYRADGSSIGWLVYSAPQPGQERSYMPLDMSGETAVAAGRALTRLAAERSGLPIRTAHRSLTDPAHRLEQEFVGLAKSLDYGLFVLMIVAALGVAILAYRWDAAPWLSVVAAVSLGACAARLAYWDAHDALAIPRTWEESDKDVAPHNRLLWPSLLALSAAAALAVSIAAVVAGHAPHDTWTNVEVIGGAAIFALGGALLAWARAGSDDPGVRAAMDRLRAGATERV